MVILDPEALASQSNFSMISSLVQVYFLKMDGKETL